MTPDQQTWMQTLDWYHNRLDQLIHARLTQLTERLSWLRTRLSQQHPLSVLQRMRQRIDELRQRMAVTLGYQLRATNDRLQHSHSRLLGQSPVIQIRNYQGEIKRLQQQARFHLTSALENRKARLSNLASTLNAISPLQTLGRGYSITSTLDGQTLSSSDSVTQNERIQTRLRSGQLISRVEKIVKDTST